MGSTTTRAVVTMRGIAASAPATTGWLMAAEKRISSIVARTRAVSTPESKCIPTAPMVYPKNKERAIM